MSEIIVFRVLKGLVVVSAYVYLYGCVKDVLEEVLQVHLNCLACCNNLGFFTASGNIPHDHHHERFNSFLQFPDLLFNGRGVLVNPYSFSFLCTRRSFEHLPRTRQ